MRRLGLALVLLAASVAAHAATPAYKYSGGTVFPIELATACSPR